MTVYSILRPATVVLALAVASPAVAQSGGYGSTQSGSAVTTTDIEAYFEPPDRELEFL